MHLSQDYIYRKALWLKKSHKRGLISSIMLLFFHFIYRHPIVLYERLSKAEASFEDFEDVTSFLYEYEDVL